MGLLLTLFSAQAAEEEDWRLLIEPSFAYPPIVWPIAGAKQTVMVPARMLNGIPWYITPEEQLHSGMSRQQIEQIALRNASQTLSKLKPTFIRNRDGIILYAVLESDQLVTASTVLSPDFPKLFENTMGPDFRIVIPNRFRIYIFPRLFAPMRKITEDVAIDFRSTPYPVSKEVFTLHKGVLICVGVLER